MIYWYEAFVLCYESSKQWESKDKSFSIEVAPLGKKNTFMICQFRNGQILKKEVVFKRDTLNNPEDLMETSLFSHKSTDLDNYQAKVSLKIQLIEDEKGRIEECLRQIAVYQEDIEGEIINIDELIASKQR